MALASDQFSMASRDLGLAAANFGGNGSQVVKQLQIQLEEQRKRRKGQQAPTARSMQMTSPAVTDLMGTGGFGTVMT